jgi:Nuclease-related domain
VILKEIDKKDNLNKFEKHGRAAEKQMAFYLKRAFQDSNDIFVINDLRIQMNDDIAQIDHLIMHRFGFTVIESKSVTSEISINEHGEWIRHYNKHSKGMPSPINQGTRQIQLLKKILIEKSEYLLKKSFISIATLSKFKYDVFVAISDNGIIKRDKKTTIDGVHKADQITENIKELISGYAKTNDKFFSLKINCHFADSAMGKISNFLLKSHKTKSKNNEIKKTIEKEPDENFAKWTPKDSLIVSKNTEIKSCSKCGSTNIKIVYGRYGYYFKCKKCNGNTAIKLKCKKDSCPVRIRKAKLKFFKECSSCGTSDLFFENEEVAKV